MGTSYLESWKHSDMLDGTLGPHRTLAPGLPIFMQPGMVTMGLTGQTVACTQAKRYFLPQADWCHTLRYLAVNLLRSTPAGTMQVRDFFYCSRKSKLLLTAYFALRGSKITCCSQRCFLTSLDVLAIVSERRYSSHPSTSSINPVGESVEESNISSSVTNSLSIYRYLGH